jgi:hypothetical protein
MTTTATWYYISGPMRDYPDFNHPAFLAVESDLRLYLSTLGGKYEITNPARNFAGNTGLDRHIYLELDIKQVLEADVIVLLPGWEQSSGARLEVDVARNTAKRFMRAREVSTVGGYSFESIEPPDLDAPAVKTGPDVTGFTVKDSGKRMEYPTGMVRDTTEGKARFDLVMPKGQPYADQMLTRWAMQMTRGADKYGIRNWEKASTKDEYERFMGSAHRHLMQWLCDERDEDHAAAVFFNVAAAEFVRGKLEA